MGTPSAGWRTGLAAYVASLFDPALTWNDIEWLARLTEAAGCREGHSTCR
jgi:isopentenyl diphosphate isomerase/L-lactate dehydrogenase-like FMN-dependent dehydrogenase